MLTKCKIYRRGFGLCLLLFIIFAEPDGKEVEIKVIGGDEAEAEHSPDTSPTSCCDPGCSCMCHLQWPGMKLIWVPVDADDGGEDGEREEEDGTDEEQSGEDGEDSEEYEEVGVDQSEAVDEQAPVEDAEMLKQNKSKFHQSLDVLIAEGHRRLSDPGPPSGIGLAVTRTQSPPVPPKQSQSIEIRLQPPLSEEENIYEATLPVSAPPPRKSLPVCKELDIPLIKVRKPARQSKLSYSTSDPTSEFQANPETVPNQGDVPPTIPPRIPMNQGGLTPVHRGGIPLPQPTLEEWRTLRPSSPSRLSPQRPTTPPPSSSHRSRPPVPNPRRLSSASLQSFTQKKGSFQTHVIIFV